MISLKFPIYCPYMRKMVENSPFIDDLCDDFMIFYDYDDDFMTTFIDHRGKSSSTFFNHRCNIIIILTWNHHAIIMRQDEIIMQSSAMRCDDAMKQCEFTFDDRWIYFRWSMNLLSTNIEFTLNYRWLHVNLLCVHFGFTCDWGGKVRHNELVCKLNWTCSKGKLIVNECWVEVNSVLSKSKMKMIVKVKWRWSWK